MVISFTERHSWAAAFIFMEVYMGEWTLWSVARPIDTKALYRWRICSAVILGLPMRPEWSEKLHKMWNGLRGNEWWPTFSNWNGYQRSVHPKLEWRLAAENEQEGNVFGAGLICR